MSARNATTDGSFISFCCGIGGSIYGLEQAGWKCVLGIDKDPNRLISVSSQTGLAVNTRLADIRNIDPKELPDVTMWECDFPAEGFRTYGKRDIDDPRNLLWKEIWRMARVKTPTVIIMTFPKDLVRGRMRGRFMEICDNFRDLHYNVQTKLLNTANYGVAIHKEVVTIIATYFNVEKMWPKASKTQPTVKDVLKQPYNNTEIIEAYVHIQPLMKSLKQGETIGTKDGKLYAYGRCFWLQPARPLIAKVAWNNVSLYHPKENRNISIEEAKLITGLPAEYPVHGDYKIQWEGVAQSSYPPFYKQLGDSIKCGIN